MPKIRLIHLASRRGINTCKVRFRMSPVDDLCMTDIETSLVTNPRRIPDVLPGLRRAHTLRSFTSDFVVSPLLKILVELFIGDIRTGTSALCWVSRRFYYLRTTFDLSMGPILVLSYYSATGIAGDMQMIFKKVSQKKSAWH